MNILKWLQSGDMTIKYLVKKYLLDESFNQGNHGYIQKYLALFNQSTSEWGGGIYSPKWISSHYTLLELKYMEADSGNASIQKGMLKLLDGLWYNSGRVSTTRYQDMCMSAMLLSILTYGLIQDKRINEIVDYMLLHQQPDGGWNCGWDSLHHPSIKSSVHTTLSVLEAWKDYEKYGYTYRLDDIKSATQKGIEVLLSRHLFKKTNGEVISPAMVLCHYPTRWKYDCFRALEYLTDLKYPFDYRMQDALNLVRDQMKKGYIAIGTHHPGKRHFNLEVGKMGRFNTFRALKILKHYDEICYLTIIQSNKTYS